MADIRQTNRHKNSTTEWSQIQVVARVSDVANTNFSPSANSIISAQKLEGDFEGLTAYLIGKHNLHPDQQREIEQIELDFVYLDKTLDTRIRTAARNFFNAIDAISNARGADLKHILLQGANYQSGDEIWHTDRYYNKRRVGLRVSGPETQVAHVDDVLDTQTDQTGNSRVIENPRITHYPLCTAWANSPGMSAADHNDRIAPVTHRKGKPNGTAGLIFTTNLDF